MYEHETIIDDARLRMHFAIVHSDVEFTPLHWHNHIEVILMLDGVMHIDVDDRSYDLHYLDILLIDTRKIHSTHTHGSSGYLLLQIPKDDVRRLIPDYDTLYLEEYHPYKADASESLFRMEEILLQMKDVYERQEKGYRLVLTSLFYTFLNELYLHHTVSLAKGIEQKKEKSLDKIELVMEYVKTHYRQSISINDVAIMLKIRPEYFCRLFRKHTNQTFLQYINTVRMVHFYYDLLHTDETIAALLEKNGITNYKVFIRMFREAYGSSPQKIRAAHT